MNWSAFHDDRDVPHGSVHCVLQMAVSFRIIILVPRNPSNLGEGVEKGVSLVKDRRPMGGLRAEKQKRKSERWSLGTYDRDFI